MSRITEILERVRDSLADPQKERWSDSRLVRLIDEAQKTISRRFELFRGEISIGLDVGKATYKLSDDVWRITRVTFNNEHLPMHTYSEMDNSDSKWMTREGAKLEAIVFNNRSMNEIRIYPKPSEDFLATYFDLSPVYGVTDTVGGYSGEPFGVLVDFNNAAGARADFESVFGVVSEVAVLSQVYLQYVRDPATVTTDLDSLELSTTFDTAIKNYVIGHAFLDDLDSQNQERGQRALAMYENEIRLLGEKTGPTNSTRAPNVRSTYRGFQ
jgi:hypothetical protein